MNQSLTIVNACGTSQCNAMFIFWLLQKLSLISLSFFVPLFNSEFIVPRQGSNLKFPQFKWWIYMVITSHINPALYTDWLFYNSKKSKDFSFTEHLLLKLNLIKQNPRVKHVYKKCGVKWDISAVCTFTMKYSVIVQYTTITVQCQSSTVQYSTANTMTVQDIGDLQISNGLI